jgi:hypothetical protein
VRATVLAIVDFPVPARPFSQKMHRSSCLSAHSYMSRRRPTRVSGRQVGSCCRWYALNGASTAIGRELRESGIPVSFQFENGRWPLPLPKYAVSACTTVTLE